MPNFVKAPKDGFAMFKGCGLPYSRRTRKAKKGSSSGPGKNSSASSTWPVGRWAGGNV